MDRFDTSPASLSDVWKQAGQLMLPVIKVGWLAIVLMWLGAMLTIYADHIVLRPVAFNVACSMLGYLVVLFFLGVLFRLTQSLSTNDVLTFKSAVRYMVRRAPAYFLTTLIFLGVIVGYYMGGSWLVHHFVMQSEAANQSGQAVMYFMLMVIAPLVVIIVFFVFALPLVVIEDCHPLRAFARSYQLVGKQWLRAFSIYGMVAVLLILTIPTTLHAHFLMRYYVYPLFVLVVYLILFPFISSWIVLMRRYLEQ